MAGQLKKFWYLYPAVSILLLLLLLKYAPPLWGLKTAYLATDVMIFFLVSMLIFLGSYMRQRPHLLGPWKSVFRRKLAMASAVILTAYVVIGLLDSVHFRKPLPDAGDSAVQYSVETSSLLDELTSSLHNRIEKTYSAPFALYLFSKENVETADGHIIREYPRLQYGGSHLKNVQERAADIFRTLAVVAYQSILAWAAILVLLAYFLQRNKDLSLWESCLAVLRGRTVMPWHVALYTVLLLLFIILSAAHFGTKYHILGTDKVGQDVFYLSLKSVRTGLVIGTLTTLVMLPFAILLGIAAGYFRGWIDDVIQYLYTTLNSIPGVLLIAAAILSIQVYIANHPELFETAVDRSDLRLLALCFILGITSWTGLCRLLRGEALKLRELEYIQASTAFGVRHLVILARHILPNIMHIVLIVVVLDFSGLVLAEAVLSYVGVGVDPSTNSWGNMINGARLEMAREPMVWWSLLAAFAFMFILVLAANLFSDAVRDAFDPHMHKE
jgi:peptide/nickel transport system permease protein